jgi:hypothetical protein
MAKNNNLWVIGILIAAVFVLPKLNIFGTQAIPAECTFTQTQTQCGNTGSITLGGDNTYHYWTKYSCTQISGSTCYSQYCSPVSSGEGYQSTTIPLSGCAGGYCKVSSNEYTCPPVCSTSNVDACPQLGATCWYENTYVCTDTRQVGSQQYCNGDLLPCDGSCSNGQCTTVDLCANKVCNNYCSGNVRYYNGDCSPTTGECAYNSQSCTYGCSGGECSVNTCSPPCPDKTTVLCGNYIEPNLGCYGPCEAGTKCTSGTCNVQTGVCSGSTTCTTGQTQTCTAENTCSGTKTCTSGVWGNCVTSLKLCSNGVCMHEADCPPCPTGQTLCSDGACSADCANRKHCSDYSYVDCPLGVHGVHNNDAVHSSLITDEYGNICYRNALDPSKFCYDRQCYNTTKGCACGNGEVDCNGLCNATCGTACNNGTTQGCIANGCSGTQTCTNNIWGNCVTSCGGTFTNEYCLSQCNLNASFGKCVANERQTACTSNCEFWQKYIPADFVKGDPESGCAVGEILYIVLGAFAFLLVFSKKKN